MRNLENEGRWSSGCQLLINIYYQYLTDITKPQTKIKFPSEKGSNQTRYRKPVVTAGFDPVEHQSSGRPHLGTPELDLVKHKLAVLLIKRLFNN